MTKLDHEAATAAAQAKFRNPSLRNLALCYLDLSGCHRRLKELAKAVYATRHLGQDRKEMSDLHAFLEEE